MPDPFIGQIQLFPFNFAPTGYAFCEGQVLPISQNTALFSLIGTMYGGDGKTTFALPDLRGNVALGYGQGPGLSDYTPGQSGGEETHTLGVTEIQAHTHVVTVGTPTTTCRDLAGNSATPVGHNPAIEGGGGPATYSSDDPNANMHPSAVIIGGPKTAAIAGGGQPHTNMGPYLTIHFCIALQGIFPPRP